MTNVEGVEYFRKRELELGEIFNQGRKITEGDKLQFALSEAHYKMRLEYAKQQDALAKEESVPQNVKVTSEVKIKR